MIKVVELLTEKVRQAIIERRQAAIDAIDQAVKSDDLVQV
jgi:hypothetical protein